MKIKEIIKDIQIPKDKNIFDLVTTLNYKIMNMVYKIINNESVKEVLYKNLLIDYAISCRMSTDTKSIPLEQLMKDLIDSATNLYEQIGNAPNVTVKQLAYEIGCNSEEKDNFGVFDRLNLILVIGMKNGIKFDF